MQTVALIDYGAGNLRSMERALLAAAALANRCREVRITSDPDFVLRADRIVLPGQGAFKDCMEGLNGRPGLRDALEQAVQVRAAPFLGVCVGMQLMVETGLEHGETTGLGWLPGVCREMATPKGEVLPHMGWNEARPTRAHPVLEPLAPARHVYFAHSYVAAVTDPTAMAAQTSHGETFSSAIGRDHMLGVQFHPEKSQSAGLALLAAFLDWKPA